ncbi:MAG: DUF2029 domain-containing protein [Selenomonadaceae bacterium]|nr:DUF2029 domain-containing protein [Selenomonadaceae bacterium]
MTRKEFWQEAFTTNRIIKDILIALVLISCLLLFLRIANLEVNSRSWLCDFYGQWALCAYAFHHVDPFPQIGAETALLPDVGIIPADWGTSPWGLLLGQVFYPGYLPLAWAKIYFGLIYLGSILLLMVVLYYTLRQQGKFFCVSMMVLATVSYGYWIAAHDGNCGGIICCLIIIACLLNRRFPILSGVLLGFAMVKPQTALLFCFAMLLARQWKTLMTTSSMVIVAWVIAAWWVDTGSLELMREFLSANIGGGKAYPGIMEPLRRYWPQLDVMPLSMLVGTLFVWLMWRSKKGQTSMLFLFTVTAIATDFWCYSWRMECFILFWPSIVAFYFSFVTHGKFRKLMFLLVGGYCYLSFYMIHYFLLVLPLHDGFTLYNLGLILCGLFLCRQRHWEKLNKW